MTCDLPCISENRTATMGCPVFDGMGTSISKHQLLFLLFPGHWPLPTACCLLPVACCPLPVAHCFLRVTHPVLFHSKHFAKRAKGPVFRSHAIQPRLSAIFQKSIRPQKKFPGAGPRASRICNTEYENRGPVPGKGLAGGGLEGPASP